MKVLRWTEILTHKFGKFRAFAKRILSAEKTVTIDCGETDLKEEVSGRITIEGVKAEGQVTIETVFDGQPAPEEEKDAVGRKVPIWGKVAPPAVLAVAVLLLLVFFSGTALAFAQPEHTLARPFKGMAITLTETGYGAVGLIENVRHIVSGYERNIVSTALQAMKVTEDLDAVPEVSVPTNDMAFFPSAECYLYPGYLDSRYSQFKYFIDNNGIVQVDVSGATTDAFLKRIKQLLYRLADGE